MTTCADVDAAWVSNVWGKAVIQSITRSIYNYDIYEDSEVEVSKFMFNKQVNFLTYLVSRAPQKRAMGMSDSAYLYFSVDVRYALQKDIDGTNYIAVRDFFDLLITTVNAQLGETWGGTIDYPEFQSGAPKIIQRSIADVKCWLGQYSFFGTKFAQL